MCACAPVWKRTNFGAFNTLVSIENNSDGAFSVPGWLKNFNASLNLNYSSGAPYTIRSGRDDNSDQIFNDRPDGVGRNSLRGDGALTLSGFFAINIPIGQKK